MDIEDNQGTDIMEDMLKVRREWVTEEKTFNSKIPEDIKPFYDRFNTGNINPDEAKAAQQKADEEEAQKKKKKDNKKKKVAKTKKKSDDDDEKNDKYKIGASEIITKFDDFYDEWKVDWSNRDETRNQEQKHDEDLTKREIMPSIQE